MCLKVKPSYTNSIKRVRDHTHFLPRPPELATPPLTLGPPHQSGLLSKRSGPVGISFFFLLPLPLPEGAVILVRPELVLFRSPVLELPPPALPPLDEEGAEGAEGGWARSSDTEGAAPPPPPLLEVPRPPPPPPPPPPPAAPSPMLTRERSSFCSPTHKVDHST